MHTEPFQWLEDDLLTPKDEFGDPQIWVHVVKKFWKDERAMYTDMDVLYKGVLLERSQKLNQMIKFSKTFNLKMKHGIDRD